MKDIMGMMGKVKEMQEKMASLQAELDELEATGVAGAGMVEVTLTAKGNMKGIKIDPSLLQPEEQEMLEDLLVTAHNMAKANAEDIAREKTQELTAGLPIPPGMKLPF